MIRKPLTIYVLTYYGIPYQVTIHFWGCQELFLALEINF